MALYLDTETTGLSAAAGDTIVEIAIVDDAGRTVLESLVNPRREIPWRATEIHGITDDMVRGKPTLNSLLPRVREIIAGEELVIFNAVFDTQFFPGRLSQAGAVSCAMRRFADEVPGYQYNLKAAAQKARHRWTGDQHRALADALACRSVWLWLEGRGRKSR